MHKIFYLNIIRTILGILCVWVGGLFCNLVVVILSLSSFAYGFYELKRTKELKTFNNKPFYYTDFVVSFDLLFPVALIVLFFVHKYGI